MYLHISPVPAPPLSQAVWDRGEVLVSFVSFKTPSIVPGTQRCQWMLFWATICWSDYRGLKGYLCASVYCGRKLIYAFILCGLFWAIFIKMLSYCTWKTVISIFLFPLDDSLISYTRRIWQKGFESLDKFMNDSRKLPGYKKQEHINRKEKTCISKCLFWAKNCVKHLTYIISHLIWQTISV